MSNINLYFSLYGPIYIYVSLISYLLILLNLLIANHRSANFSNLHMLHKDVIYGILFTLIILSLLGTPPTIGFFGKILSFLLLTNGSLLGLNLSILITLVLLIFYLQTIRSRGVTKKNIYIPHKLINIFLVQSLISAQIIFLIFPIFVPLLFDILYSMFF